MSSRTELPSTSSSLPRSNSGSTEGSASRTTSSPTTATNSITTSSSGRGSNASTLVTTSTVFGQSSATQIVFTPASPLPGAGNNSSSNSTNGSSNAGMSSGMLLAVIIGSLILFPIILLCLYRSVSLLRRSRNLKKDMNQETFSGISSTAPSNRPFSKNRMSQLAVRTMAASIAESVASEDDIFVRSVSPAPSERSAKPQEQQQHHDLYLKRNASLPSFGYAPRYQPLNRGNSIVSGSDAYYYQPDSSTHASLQRSATNTFRYSQNYDAVNSGGSVAAGGARYQHSARYPELYYHSSAYTQEYQLANHPNQVYSHFLVSASQSNSSNSNSNNGDISTAPSSHPSSSSGTPLLDPVSSSNIPLTSPSLPIVVAVGGLEEERGDAMQSPPPPLLSRSPSPLNLHDDEV